MCLYIIAQLYTIMMEVRQRIGDTLGVAHGDDEQGGKTTQVTSTVGVLFFRACQTRCLITPCLLLSPSSPQTTAIKLLNMLLFVNLEHLLLSKPIVEEEPIGTAN